MTDPKSLKIAVLKGGFSSEREVSLKSGAIAAEALRSLGCHVDEIDVQDKQFKVPSQTNVVFIALHGTGGEDGVIQGILEKQNFVFTGSDSKASRLAFDKIASKKVFREHGLVVADDTVLQHKDSKQTKFDPPFGYPCVVKPSREGSSIGVQIVQKSAQMKKAVEEAFKKDSDVLVEQFIEGKELTVGILGEQVLPVIEIRPKSGWFDYKNKYTDGLTEEIVPAPIPEEMAWEAQQMAKKAHQILGCRDLSRSDFRVDKNGKIYILEVNTIPGMTAQSLLPKAAAAAGIPFPKVCFSLIELALNRKKSNS